MALSFVQWYSIGKIVESLLRHSKAGSDFPFTRHATNFGGSKSPQAPNISIREIRKKRDGEVGYLDKRKQYPEVLKAWKQKADLAHQTGAKMKRRQQATHRLGRCMSVVPLFGGCFISSRHPMPSDALADRGQPYLHREAASA